eukprot:scaffold1220_cov104-Skeletonema_dohrnii-CCMP3373.AAC.2
MSTNSEEQDNMRLCAACGIAEVDDIKLKGCAACDLVRYCGDTCQQDHMPQHMSACKKRAAELRDEILFKQPESSHHGDCPICCIPLPIDAQQSTMSLCCSTILCDGCNFANQTREVLGSLDRRCPFCRHPVDKGSQREARMKRIEANDPVALRVTGNEAIDKGDYKSAFEYFSKAARLGDISAHFSLSLMYDKGEGVEKDKKKEVYHLEHAAIGGQPNARYNLGCEEWDNGRLRRAVKHFIISAKLGYDKPLDALKVCYREGLVSKEDFAAALRGQQAAVDATKSPQREAVESAREKADTARVAR